MNPIANLVDRQLLGAIGMGLLVAQLVATLILLSRLIRGARRHPPLAPKTSHPERLAVCTSNRVGSVSIIVPTLNEAERIEPCLQGLSQQGNEVREIAIVDSNSGDGTREIVKIAGETEPRIRLLTDDPLPSGWIGRPWALHYGFTHADPDSEWILGIDADTQPQPGLVASLLDTAITEGYDLMSLSPQFILIHPGEWWLQPALLITLLYRFDASGVQSATAERVMANGQCFLIKRSVLTQLGGYTSAASSFCDDVTLARHAAARGFKVGFLDGARVLRVRMYAGMAETWREWGRSLDLKDASEPLLLWSDVAFLLLVQGLPILLLSGLGIYAAAGGEIYPVLQLAIGLNVFLIAIRFALLFAIYPSYYRERFSIAAQCFWLSPLADPVAALRIFLSAIHKPTQWRGRSYS